MKVLLAIFIFYCIPLISMYVYAKMAYGKDGIFEDDDFDMTMFWVMICPLLNWLGGTLIWGTYPKKNNKLKNGIKDFVVKKIFNIKSEEETEVEQPQSTLVHGNIKLKNDDSNQQY